jgi:glutathione S-transferase
MALVLYEIAWSHFCEKARWCLDFKGVPYTRVAINPYTRRQVTALGSSGTVPVLVDEGRVIEGSAAIAAHLEVANPEPPLLPADPSARADVLAIQERCDEELGPDSRRLAYARALANPNLLRGTLLWSRAPGRWINGVMLRMIEPRLRRRFGIYPDEVERSRGRVRALLDDLQERLSRGPFLVGETLTLADITAVSLMGPLAMIPEFAGDSHFAPILNWRRRAADAHHLPQRYS